MKKSLFLILLALSYTVAAAADWAQVSDYPYYFYDKSSIQTRKANDDSLFIELWVMTYINHEGKTYNTKEKVIIACGEGRHLTRYRVIVYDDEGNPIEEEQLDDINQLKWKEAVPGSNDDILSKKMCRLAYNKHLRPQKQTQPAPQQYEKGILNL